MLLGGSNLDMDHFIKALHRFLLQSSESSHEVHSTVIKTFQVLLLLFIQGLALFPVEPTNRHNLTRKRIRRKKKKEGGIEREKVPEAAGPLESVVWSRHASETCLKGRKEEKERKGTNQNKKGTNQTNQMISRS